ncbi:MAG: CHRD domain-containing protein [Candidatus Limnocylindrales bacterium]
MTRRRLSALVALLMLASVALLSSSIATAHFGHGKDGLRARLTGAQEIQAADMDGRGTARFKIHQADSELCFRIFFSRIATPTAAHIHAGLKGANGPVVVPLFAAATADDAFLDRLERGKASGCVRVDPTLLQAIKDDPGAYYTNVHNARYPDGAIRGQLRGTGFHRHR